HLRGFALPPSIINRPRARPAVDRVEAPVVVQLLRPPGEAAARSHPHRRALRQELHPYGLGENSGGKRGGQLPGPRRGRVALGHLFIPPGDVADPLRGVRPPCGTAVSTPSAPSRLWTRLAARVACSSFRLDFPHSPLWAAPAG